MQFPKRHMLFASALIGLASPLVAQSPEAPRASTPDPAAVERLVETQHSITLNGKRFEYTAHAGTLILRDDDGRPTASMFYVAYTAKPGAKPRPVTFVWNGGPGSSSMWLHLASFGPKRIELPNPGTAVANPPHRLVDNADTLLVKSDLVFLDMINTGYSRPLGTRKPADFMTADADIDAFTRGIKRYLAITDQWNAPKFLFGESYGTSRAAGVVDRLQRNGVQVNGVAVLGSILDISRISNDGDRLYISTLPTYAVTAVYHGKVAPPADQNSFITEVKRWAEREYSPALAQGYLLPPTEKMAIAEQLSRYTGLPKQFLLDHDLRITPGVFRAELLRDRKIVLGELDARYTASDTLSPEGAPRFDPSGDPIFRAIAETMAVYMKDELRFQTELEYRRSYTSESFDFRRGRRWSFGMYISDLSDALTINPKLQIHSLNGLYDLSTVFYGADYDYAHLAISPALAPNIHYAYFKGGHMAYTDPAARRAIAADISRLYDEAASDK